VRDCEAELPAGPAFRPRAEPQAGSAIRNLRNRNLEICSAAADQSKIGSPLLSVVDSYQRSTYRRNIVPVKLQATRTAARRGAQRISRKGRGGRRTARGGRDEMGSSVEGLKLRRMRVRNEISLNYRMEGGTERAEDLEALREELHRLSKQIEEAQH
jgi:hypothetical protein